MSSQLMVDQNPDPNFERVILLSIDYPISNHQISGQSPSKFIVYRCFL